MFVVLWFFGDGIEGGDTPVDAGAFNHMVFDERSNGMAERHERSEVGLVGVGHREELGDAAIYVNPLSQTEILSAFDDMIEHRENYAGLIKKQKNITPHTIENALRCINDHLLEAAKIRSLWQ